MKRFFLTFFCVIIMLISLFVPSFASQLTYGTFHFPEPSDEYNFVLASENSCRVIYPIVLPGGFSGSINSSSFSGSYDTSKLFAMATWTTVNNTIQVTITNMFSVDVDAVLVNYNTTGTVLNSLSFSIPGNGTRTLTFSDSAFLRGIYTNNIIKDDTFSSLPLGNISFSNNLDYTQDMYQIQAALTNLYNAINTVNSSVNTVDTDLTVFYNFMHAFVSDVFYIDPSGDPQSTTFWKWDDFGEKLASISQYCFNLASEFSYWYQYQYIPKTDQTNQLLQDILNALTVENETQPNLENETEMESAIDQYAAAEGQIMDEANSYIDDVDSVIGDFTSDFEGIWIRPAFWFVNFMFNQCMTNQYSLFIIIPCIFGLICLVLGRHVQRG